MDVNLPEQSSQPVTLTSRLLRVNETALAVGSILVVAALAHLILVPWLGFYKEDWYLIWRGSTAGGASIIPLFSVDRPLVGYVFAVLYPLLGASPLGWHLTAFTLRLAGALFVYATARMVWPEKRPSAFAVAVLFIVYPGYLQQYNAVNTLFWLTALAAALASLCLTVASLRVHQRSRALLYSVLALLLAAFYPAVIEFYIGFEAVRLALIWTITAQKAGNQWKQVLVQTVRRYSPYLIPAISFLVWRLFFFESSRNTTDVSRVLSEYLATPLPLLARLVVESFKDFVETVFLAWVVPFNNRLYPQEIENFIFGGVAGLLAAVLSAVAYRVLQRGEDNPGEHASSYRAWIGLGAFAVFVTLLPLVAAGRDVNFDRIARADRYTLHASFGAVILLVGLLSMFLSQRARLVMVSLLVGVSVYTHYQQNTIYREFWQQEKGLWWQLSWRAPALKDGTLLFVTLPPSYAFQEGYEAWAPASLIYYPEDAQLKISGEVLNPETRFEILRGGERDKLHRTIEVPRDFDHSLILSLPGQMSCLHVYDGKKYELSANEDPLVQLVAAHSQIDLIRTDTAPATPPAEIFGREPEHGWCYYYQKAQLARQNGDWQEITRLGDEVRQNKLSPFDRIEWMPFLEGYASTGRDKDAKNLAAIIKTESGPRNLICDQLRTTPDYPVGYAYEKVVQYLCTFDK